LTTEQDPVNLTCLKHTTLNSSNAGSNKTNHPTGGNMIVIAKLKAREGQEATMEAALRDMVKNVAVEKGTEVYTLHRSSEDPAIFMFYEKYKDSQAFKEHSATPHFKALFDTVKPLLAAPPDIAMYEELAMLDKP
jgi:quinol monooxygenase YgiN